jgi:phosphoenolpyruvate phosphomutase
MKKVYLGMSADILHAGHINILEKSSKLGEITVGLLSDEAIKSYKREPIISYENRLRVISNIKYVNNVIKQDTLSYINNLQILKPDIVVHGDDWNKGPQSNAREEVINTLEIWGGKLVEFPYTEGISTTSIINKIINKIINLC